MSRRIFHLEAPQTLFEFFPLGNAANDDDDDDNDNDDARAHNQTTPIKAHRTISGRGAAPCRPARAAATQQSWLFHS